MIVPRGLATTSAYRATLGHKANHSFSGQENAKYDHVFDHPRFGHIKAIRTLRRVERGEEITVNYGYGGEDGVPPWYGRAAMFCDIE